MKWTLRRRIAAVMLAGAAAAVLIAGLLRRGGGSRPDLATAIAAHEAAEASLEHSQLGDADRHSRRALGLLEQLARYSNDRRIRFQYAAALETQALIQSAAGQPDHAVAFFRKAIAVWAKLLADDQRVGEVRWRLARCLSRQAPVLTNASRWEEAEQALERGSIACRTRIADAPSDRRVDRELSRIRNQLGLLFLHTGRWREALEMLESAVREQRELIEASAQRAADEELLIELLDNLARTYAANGQPELSLRKIGEARELAERLTGEQPSTARYRDILATLLEREAAEIGRDPHKAALARGLLEQAVAIRESLALASPDEPAISAKLAETCGMLAESYADTREFARAEEFQRKELSCQSRLHREHPGVMQYRFGHGRALHNLADLLRRCGKAPEALPLSRQAAPFLESVYRQNVLDEDHRRAASNAYWLLCTLELDTKDHRAAAKAVSSYQSIEPRGFEEPHESATFWSRCARLCREEMGSSPAENKGLARSYSDRALEALAQAVRFGFRDLNELTHSHLFDSVREHPDFARLVEQVKAIDEALVRG